jgi:hypothetical protein
MRRWHLAPFIVLAAFIAFIPLDAGPAPRIVAIGDVHGADVAFVSILQRAGLIDSQRRWTGGTAVLVQVGDFMDRGPGDRAVMDLLIALEAQAAAAGGRVQALLGNHEVMNLLGENRDVAPEVFQSFADDRSESRREQGFQAEAKIRRGQSLDKAAWLAAHPPGFIEYHEALKANAPYGRWLRSKPILAEIDGTVFMHAGINPDFTKDSLDSINRRVRKELSEWDDGVRWLEQHDLAPSFSKLSEIVAAAEAELTRLQAKFKRETFSDDDVSTTNILRPVVSVGSSSLLNPEGPLWFRGYSTWTDEEGAGRMAALLRKYRVKRFATGHTPQLPGHIRTRFGGALFLIDTGMLDGRFFPGGRPSALEIVGDAATPLYVENASAPIVSRALVPSSVNSRIRTAPSPVPRALR